MTDQQSDHWVKNPIEWTGAQLKHAAHAMGAVGHSLHHIQETMHVGAIRVRRIGLANVRHALIKGAADYGAFRTDVIFLCVAYPVLGLVLGRWVFGQGLLPLLFPLVSGFALIGPLAAVGLYEMSRRRELDLPVRWTTPFEVFRAPAAGAIAVLGLLLTGLFLLWLFAAWKIYGATIGPDLPVSTAAFIHDVFTTRAGLVMIGVGVAVGFVFALVAMSISVVSFPLLLDRDVGLDVAIRTSVRAVKENPVPMAMWALIVAGALTVGSIPLLIGLVVVIPVLGHATWHLYRELVPR